MEERYLAGGLLLLAGLLLLLARWRLLDPSLLFGFWPLFLIVVGLVILLTSR